MATADSPTSEDPLFPYPAFYVDDGNHDLIETNEENFASFGVHVPEISKGR